MTTSAPTCNCMRFTGDAAHDVFGVGSEGEASPLALIIAALGSHEQEDFALGVLQALRDELRALAAVDFEYEPPASYAFKNLLHAMAERAWVAAELYIRLKPQSPSQRPEPLEQRIDRVGSRKPRQRRGRRGR